MADKPDETILDEPPEEEGDDQLAGGGANVVEPVTEDDLEDAPDDEDPDADS